LNFRLFRHAAPFLAENRAVPGNREALLLGFNEWMRVSAIPVNRDGRTMNNLGFVAAQKRE